LAPKLDTVWQSFALATSYLFEEVDIDMTSILEKWETAWQGNSLSSRIISNYKQLQEKQIDIF